MAQRPRPYRPIDPTAARTRRERAYDPAKDPDNYDTLADAYRDTYIGATINEVERLFTPGTRPRGWDPLDHVPDGYDEYASAFARAQNPEQLEVIRNNIDARLANRERREKRGAWSTFKSDLLAGIFDPSILIAGPTLKGAGIVGGAVKGAVGVGSVVAAQEGVNYALDPTMTPTEGALRAGSGVAFGGVLGGVVGGVTRRAGAGVAPTTLKSPGRNRVIQFVLHDLEGGGKVVNNQDGGGTTKYGITQNNHPEVNVAELTAGQAEAIARRKYWLPEFDKVHSSLAAVAFDAYYISGSKKLVNEILRSGDARTGIAIYRRHLADLATQPKKKRFKKAWNNRVDRLAAFIGAPKDARYDVAAATSPRRVDFGERGYLDVRDGPTGLRDENGNYIPAAFVRGKPKVEDEFTLVPVAERPHRFENVADVEHRAVEVEVPRGPEPGEKVRPQVRDIIDDEIPWDRIAPRKTDTDLDAAIELDRLERGDAEAVAQTVGDKPRFRNLNAGEFDGTVDDYVRRYVKGMGREDPAMLQFAVNNAEAIDIAFKQMREDQAVYNRIMGHTTDNLPFTLKDKARGAGLEIDDMLFMRGPVTEKGLAGLNQPELDRLAKIIMQLSKRDPEAAKIWMGSTWNPGQKLGIGTVKKRLNSLVARRHGLKQTAGERYSRDPIGADDGLERQHAADYRNAVNERIDTVHVEIGRLKTERDFVLKDYHPNDPARRAMKAEYEAKISLQYERIAALHERRKAVDQELRRYDPESNLDGYDALRNMADGENVAARAEAGRALDETEVAEDLVELNKLEAAKRRLQQTDVGELRQKMAAKHDVILQMHSVARDRALGSRADEPYVFTKKEQARLDQLYREVGDLLGRVTEVEAMQAADRDLDGLPFALSNRDSRAELDGPDVDGDHIVIDSEAILASFKEKPWTQGVHGAPGLPEDVFQTPEEWLNFVYFHEREHVQNPRLPDESLADYESRINARALDALKGENAPWKPVDGWKEELVLRPTPVGQFMRLVKNPVNYAYESLMRLASDYDLRLQRNLVPGGASAAGGSVYQRSLRWQALGADYYNAVSDLYLKYVRGRGSDGTMSRQFALFRHRKGAPGKMSFREFDQAIGRAQITGTKSGIGEVDEAAAMLDGLFRRIREEEERLGLLPGKESVERELKAVKGLIEGVEKGPRTAEIDNLLGRWKDRAAQLEEQLAENVELPGKQSLPYFERLWNVRAMMERPDEIKRIFAEGYQREGQDARSAWASATALYDDLTQDPTITAIEVGARPGSLRARRVPVENSEVVDFIHQDSSVILARHMRRNGAAVEMTRAFGDPTGEVEADRVYAALLGDGLKEDEIQAAMQIWYDMRDRIIGGFHGGNPLSTTNRIVRSVKHYTRVAVMGLSGISQLTDFVRSAWVVGPNSLAKTAIGHRFFSEAAGYDPGQYARAAGEALDVELGILGRRMIEDDDWALLGNETAAERWLADVQIPFFILNGVTPFTVLMKRWVARTVPTLVIDRAVRVADAVRSGKAVPQEDATWLREVGIDEHDAQLLADLPRETTPGGLHLVDLDKWAETGPGARGKELMLGAISGTTRRGVATPGPLNRPAIFDGVVISKKQQKEAWERRWAAEKAHDDAREEVIRLRRTGMGPGDDMFDDAVEKLKEAAGTARHLRNNIGVAGRKEAPLMSLPLQLQSFSMSQASKLAHAVLSDRDKHKLAGLLSLWAGGMLVSWLKGEFTGSNEHATIDEHLMRGFQNSGIMTWFSIPLEGAKGLLKVAAEEGGLLEDVIGEDRPGLQDNTGVLGPGIGLGIGGLEGLFGMGFDGSDLPASQRSYQIRRMVPFGNMIYFNWLTKQAFGLVTPEEEATVNPLPAFQEDHYGTTIEQLMGFSVGDVDPTRTAELQAGAAEAAEFETIDSQKILERVAATKGRSRRRPRSSARLSLAQEFQR